MNLQKIAQLGRLAAMTKVAQNPPTGAVTPKLPAPGRKTGPAMGSFPPLALRLSTNQIKLPPLPNGPIDPYTALDPYLRQQSAKKWGWRGQPNHGAAMTPQMFVNFSKQLVTGDHGGAYETMMDSMKMRYEGGIEKIKQRDEYRRLNPPSNQRPSIMKALRSAGVPSNLVMPWSSDASWNPRDTIRGWKNHIFGK
jgi:hypothetical protein